MDRLISIAQILFFVPTFVVCISVVWQPSDDPLMRPMFALGAVISAWVVYRNVRWLATSRVKPPAGNADGPAESN